MSDWRRTPCSTSACVEVKRMGADLLLIRAGEDQEPIIVTGEEWTQFLVGAKAGAFDDI
jgi:hypothetical protein